MALEYVKLWTIFENDPWVQSLNCGQRGLFLQLIIFTKAGGAPYISLRSYSAMAQRCGCDDSTCAKYLRKFAEDAKINLTETEHGTIIIEVCNYQYWQDLRGERGIKEKVENRRKVREKSVKNLLSKPIQANPSQDICRVEIPYEEIVSDLNAVCRKNFKPQSRDTREHISARWSEGFRLGDFKHVHRVKGAEWGPDPKMSLYLRPSTLYAKGKFESYLNQGLTTVEKTKDQIEFEQALEQSNRRVERTRQEIEEALR